MLDEPAILGEIRPQHLDRDRTLERQILGAIDDAHAAAADLVLQPICSADDRAELVGDFDVLLRDPRLDADRSGAENRDAAIDGLLRCVRGPCKQTCGVLVRRETGHADRRGERQHVAVFELERARVEGGAEAFGNALRVLGRRAVEQDRDLVACPSSDDILDSKNGGERVGDPAKQAVADSRPWRLLTPWRSTTSRITVASGIPDRLDAETYLRASSAIATRFQMPSRRSWPGAWPTRSSSSTARWCAVRQFSSALSR